MKTIHVDNITEKVSEICISANYDLGEDMYNAFKQALQTEVSETGRDVLEVLIENADLARTNRVPMCQDTGVPVFYVEIGQDCHIKGGSLIDAINEGVRKGYKDGYLRNSMCKNPLTDRGNTGDNTPAVIHTDIVPGDKMLIRFSAKGGGSENMSRLQMLKPSDGIDGVKKFVLETVRLAGPNACPPVVVGVGVGGNFERCAYLAKKSLFRHIGERHADPQIAALEEELLQEVNKLGIGPQGMGGKTTAVDVKIEVVSSHIAALPVAVNLNCHATRHQEVVF